MKFNQKLRQFPEKKAHIFPFEVYAQHVPLRFKRLERTEVSFVVPFSSTVQRAFPFLGFGSPHFFARSHFLLFKAQDTLLINYRLC